jgi:hypothetical protein
MKIFSVHVLGQNCVAAKASRHISLNFFLIKPKLLILRLPSSSAGLSGILDL